METLICDHLVQHSNRSPHSLGTLIEWKQDQIYQPQTLNQDVPTRWGH